MLVEEIRNYKPRKPGSEVFGRVLEINDDGHASKSIRALENGRNTCAKYDGQVGEVHGDMWDKLLHMVIDSVEQGGERWVRSAGFEEAWAEVPQRAMANL
jgi:predicted RNA-binding protein with RPS1 domain